MPDVTPTKKRHSGTPGEVFATFLLLGLTSFGGPIAHLGYFREAFVVRRGWLSDSRYAELVALAQFLPGPTSSQVGMAIGLGRAGSLGFLAAFVGFTLPSALALTAFALFVNAFAPTDTGWILGLKAVAIGVVAHAVVGMAKTLSPDLPRATVASSALIATLLLPTALMQPIIILVAGIIGVLLLREPSLPQHVNTAPAPEPRERFSPRVKKSVAWASLALFGALLVGLPVLVALTSNSLFGFIDIFYRSGSLVFGGGHVVLPLLESQIVPTGLVSENLFLAGYGATQAMPGPLFTVASFLGAVSSGTPSGIAGAIIALIAVFLPGILLLLAALPAWERLREAAWARRALSGVNASVVGILAATLLDPMIFDAFNTPLVLAIALGVFLLLVLRLVPVWVLVLASAGVGAVLL